jgi:hypothetical protein
MAYRRDANQEMWGDEGHGLVLAYSPNPLDYIPLCRKCHFAYDIDW